MGTPAGRAWTAPDAPGSGRDGVLVRAGRAFGSPLRLHVVAGPGVDGAAVDAAWDAVLAELAACDAALSRFRGDSDLARLNRAAGTGGNVDAAARLARALAVADRARRVTGGRFDPAIAMALDDLGERAAFRPEPVSPSRAPAPGGRPRTVPAPGRAVDLGGVGKGLALRWSLAAARRIVGTSARVMIECGGDLVCGGPAGDAWPIGIEDPAGAPGSDPVAVVELRAGALATSSVRVRHWRDATGRPVHHLLDPVTGAPARTGLLAVSVMAPDPAWAEVWSKALFLAGRGGIADEARARDLAAWWVTAEGRVGMSPAGRVRTVWADEGRVGS